MQIRKNLETKATNGVMNSAIIIGKCLGAESMVSVHAVCEIVIGQIRTIHNISVLSCSSI